MSQFRNGVEILQVSNNSTDYLILPAGADLINPGTFVWFDTSSDTVKPFTPADSTATYDQENYIIGIADAGKVANETRCKVLMKGVCLLPLLRVNDSTSSIAIHAGADLVIGWDTTLKRYEAHDVTVYNAEWANDITISPAFAVAADEDVESDSRIKVIFNGWDRYNSLD